MDADLLSQQYDAAYHEAEKLIKTYERFTPDQRMMMFSYALVMDKIAIGRKAEGLTEGDPTPNSFYAYAAQLVADTMPLVGRLMRMRASMAPEETH